MEMISSVANQPAPRPGCQDLARLVRITLAVGVDVRTPAVRPEVLGGQALERHGMPVRAVVRSTIGTPATGYGDEKGSKARDTGSIVNMRTPWIRALGSELDEQGPVRSRAQAKWVIGQWAQRR